MPQVAEYEPTREQIREECKRIQGEWNDTERRSRGGYGFEKPEFLMRRVRIHAGRKVLG